MVQPGQGQTVSELSKLQERVFELESQLGIKSTTWHMYDGTTDVPEGVDKIIGHMPPVTMIEFADMEIRLWGGPYCLTLNLDAKPFTKPFSFEVAP